MKEKTLGSLLKNQQLDKISLLVQEEKSYLRDLTHFVAETVCSTWADPLAKRHHAHVSSRAHRFQRRATRGVRTARKHDVAEVLSVLGMACGAEEFLRLHFFFYSRCICLEYP